MDTYHVYRGYSFVIQASSLVGAIAACDGVTGEAFTIFKTTHSNTHFDRPVAVVMNGHLFLPMEK